MKSPIVTRGARAALFFAFLCAAAGCTIADQYADINATDSRIAIKTDQLQQEADMQKQFQTQMKQLSDDLTDKKLTSDQLDARLAQLQRQNRHLASDNAKKRAQRDALEAELAQYRSQVAAIKASGATDEAAMEAQKRQLDQLKQQIHNRLLALAQAG
ncbi:hypothetical protein LJ655_01025 [Paraburkholderia sp. MMS20-SJTN17]|uniref:Lipoprotein n=1 Tax=Paraburkholderia translucens TaxID=2886945 RepID=A0ABS8K6W5_9BURK|nr:hypothetical protein [Paraburkholderia sp. MMS20-SJTN17]MCC8400486.1 hypothetical protein [Paraburkholderia sp. MMS20-SJTN17]